MLTTVTDKDLEFISGGAIEWSNKLHAYLVKDDVSGNVLASVYDQKEAVKMDKRLNVNNH